MRTRETRHLAAYAREKSASHAASLCPPHSYIGGTCLYCDKPQRRKKANATLEHPKASEAGSVSDGGKGMLAPGKPNEN